MLRRIGAQGRKVPPLALLAPFARADGLAQRVVAGVRRLGIAVVDEVAVEVDIVLGHAPHMREAIGVDRVDEQDRGVGRQALGGGEPGHLDARPAEPFRAMGAGHHDHQAACIRAAEQGDIGRQLLARGAGGRIAMGHHLQATGSRRGAERFARCGIGRTEVPAGVHERCCSLRFDGPIHSRSGPPGAMLPGCSVSCRNWRQ
jgi:hypothetical protein